MVTHLAPEMGAYFHVIFPSLNFLYLLRLGTATYRCTACHIFPASSLFPRAGFLSLPLYPYLKGRDWQHHL